MALLLITPPTATPVTLAEAKAHLRVDTSDEDVLIQTLIDTATQHIDGKDGWLNRALKPQTYELFYDRFPCGPLAIPMRPLIEVLNVKYDDEDGFEQTVDPADYEVDLVSDPGWVVPIAGLIWPDTLDAINVVRVRFIAGYPDVSGDITTVPTPIRHAILMMVADLYEHRESVSPDGLAAVPIPASVKALLAPYQVFL